jgi:arginyl-tRNA synthetase
MFALQVQLSTEKIEVEYEEYGKKKKAFASVVKFDLVKTETGIGISTDLGELTFLRDLLEQVSDEVDSLIKSKDVGKDGTGAKNDEFENADGSGDPIPMEAIEEVEDIVIPEEKKEEEMPF